MRRIDFVDPNYCRSYHLGHIAIRFLASSYILVDNEWWEIDKRLNNVTEDDIYQMTSKKSFNDLIDLYYDQK